MRKTTVSIVNENQNSVDTGPIESFIPEEVSKVIDQLVELAVKHNIPRQDINELITSRRRRYEYKENVNALPEECEKVKEFRVKLENFFNFLEIVPLDMKQFIWDYEFWIANYHIEIPVAAYRLYLENMELSEENIFKYAKAKMKPSDEYYKARKKGYKGNWRVSKRMNIKRFNTYFNKLCDIRLEKFIVEKRFKHFLTGRKHKHDELPWLKLVFLIENYY